MPDLNGISLTDQQQLIAKISVASLLIFGLGFSCGRQSGVQDRIADSSKPEATGTSKPASAPASTPAPESEEPADPVTPDTSINEEVDPLTDETKYTFVLRSANEMANSIGMAERDVLIVRCKSNTTEAYIQTTPYVSSDGQSVKLRWNGGEITSQWWGPSSGGGALFSEAPVSLLSKMTDADTLVISYKPYSKTAVSAVFEFDQARSDLKKMQEVCK